MRRSINSSDKLSQWIVIDESGTGFKSSDRSLRWVLESVVLKLNTYLKKITRFGIGPSICKNRIIEKSSNCNFRTCALAGMSRLSLSWFILSSFKEYFQIIWSLFSYLYCKVKCFQENESFEVKKGPFKYLWTLFFYTQESLVCWFLVFSMKMSQKILKMCLKWAIIVFLKRQL